MGPLSLRSERDLGTSEEVQFPTPMIASTYFFCASRLIVSYKLAVKTEYRMITMKCLFYCLPIVV